MNFRTSTLLLALFLLVSAGAGWAQCGVTMSCPGAPGAGLPTVCTPNVCFVNDTAMHRYEQEHNCIYPNPNLCGGKAIDTAKQCCGKDATTGNAKPIDRQIISADTKFSWDTYQKQCPDMRQSEAPPDGLWKQCVVGERHTVSDDYAIVIVKPNGSGRSYCIDGCSTPPGVVNTLNNTNTFLIRDKDNPTGYPTSSFFNACMAHDICYQSCNGGLRNGCDDRLLQDSLTACETIPADHETTITRMSITTRKNTREACVNAANAMHTGLSLLGGSAFGLRRAQYCQCC